MKRERERVDRDRRWAGRVRVGASRAGEPGKRPVVEGPLGGRDLFERGEAVGLAAFLEGRADGVFLGAGVVEPHDRGGVAQGAVGSVLLLDEAGDHAHVAGDFRVGWCVDEVADLGWVELAVAVDAAVALLQGDERPGQVEVDEVVALLVEVDAFGGDVRGD